MGFMSGFGRLLAGKPVFEKETDVTSDPAVVTPPQPVPAPNTLHDAHGRKIIPQVAITHLQSHRDGNTMTVMAWVTNHSELAIRLDDCTMLGQRLQVHYELTPHQNHEIVLYRGPIAATDRDHRTRLTFRLMANTDEFEIDYVTKFYRNSDGTFIVSQLHQEGGIRDI